MRTRYWSTRRDVSKELKIIELYKSGISIKEILEQVGLSPQNRACIGEARRRHNVPQRGYPNRNKTTTRKYYWDFDFFGRDSPETAYWAGFIMADGYTGPSSRGSFHLGLSIGIKDRMHLETFCSHLGLTTNQIRERKRQTPYGFSHTCEISVTHPSLGKALERWGIIPKKTTVWIRPQVSIGAMPHFLRGWLDGDGNITVSKTQAMSICGHPIAMQWIGDALVALGYSGTYSIRHEKNYAYLSVGGILQMLQVYYLLHGNESPRLDRKWSRIESYHSPRLDLLRQLNAHKSLFKFG